MAAWIQGERKRLKLTTAQLAERLALVGAPVGEQTISVWESYAGRNPSGSNIDALERIFGSQAPTSVVAGGSDLSAVVEAIDRQTEAITRLVTFLMDRPTPDPAGLRAIADLVAERMSPPHEPSEPPSRAGGQAGALPANAHREILDPS